MLNYINSVFLPVCQLDEITTIESIPDLKIIWHIWFVCLGLTSLWNIWGHITTVPACSSGTQVGPVSVYCDGVGCPVSVAWHSCVASHWSKYHCYKRASSWYDIRGPFHKSSYEQVLLYEFVEPVLNYRSNEFVALTNLCETGPRCLKAMLNPKQNQQIL